MAPHYLLVLRLLLRHCDASFVPLPFLVLGSPCDTFVMYDVNRSRCNIHVKNGKVYMKHNSLGDDVPIVVILRAMGAMSDQEIVQLVRFDSWIVFGLSWSRAATAQRMSFSVTLTQQPCASFVQ